MPMPLQWILSLVFIVQMYVAMAVLAIVYTPIVLFRREAAFWAVHAYTGWVRLSARVLVGLRSEVRGTPPEGEALIVAKHQSFFDIILLVDATPRPKFIMKKELIWAPILGWYALKIGCVPVDRGKRGAAIKGMMQDVKNGAIDPGQLIIYPQGTRVAPEASLPYKVGAGLLYSQLGQTCIPAATNVGVFWPRHGILRRRGLAVVEFLDPIEPGKAVPEFMAQLEAGIEDASDRLMAEAGFDAPAARAAAAGAGA